MRKAHLLVIYKIQNKINALKFQIVLYMLKTF